MLGSGRRRRRHGGNVVLCTRRSTGRRIGAVLLLGLLAPALAGCGDDQPASTLPAFTPSATPPSAAAADEAAVERAYREYLEAFNAIAADGDPDPQRLRAFATAEYAQRQAEGISGLFDEGLRVTGPLPVEVRSIRINGSDATLLACIDPTKRLTVKTGRAPSPGQTGQPRGQQTATLVRQDDQWLMANIDGAPGSC